MFVHRVTREYVQRTPEGRLLDDGLNELRRTDVVEVCDVCEKPGTEREPLNWLNPQCDLTSPVYHEWCADELHNERLNRQSALDIYNHPNTRRHRD